MSFLYLQSADCPPYYYSDQSARAVLRPREVSTWRIRIRIIIMITGGIKHECNQMYLLTDADVGVVDGGRSSRAAVRNWRGDGPASNSRVTIRML